VSSNPILQAPFRRPGDELFVKAAVIYEDFIAGVPDGSAKDFGAR